MAAPYGSVAAIKQLLQTDPAGGGSFSTDDEARITAVRATVSVAIEDMTGAIFGAATPETVLVDGEAGSVLFLPKGIRSVTTILESPTWNGAAWTLGTALATTSFRLNAPVSNGAYRQLVREDGGWSGRYAITGVWEDRFATVPDEITYAVNYVSAQVFKNQSASPHGLMGVEGALVPIANAFKAPEVVNAVSRWTVGPSSWAV